MSSVVVSIIVFLPSAQFKLPQSCVSYLYKIYKVLREKDAKSLLGHRVHLKAISGILTTNINKDAHYIEVEDRRAIYAI